jgi:hypothetical protein
MTRGIVALALLLGVSAIGLSGCAQPQSPSQFQSVDPGAYNCVYVYSESCPGPKRWVPIGSGG